MQNRRITYINQKQSQEFDVELMSEEVGFTLDILMELAGQSIANTVHRINKENKNIKKVLVLCGPGNNGGDGIVAARHLKMLGFDSVVGIFREVKQPFFKRLISTCIHNDIPIKMLKENIQEEYEQYDLLIDSILGFSFKPPLREPFDIPILCLAKTKQPILSVDIPSGWNVELGNTENLFTPNYLISLTLPKLGVKDFQGRHFLGGRFIPSKLKSKYEFELPEYEGTDTILELSNL